MASVLPSQRTAYQQVYDHARSGATTGMIFGSSLSLFKSLGVFKLILNQTNTQQNYSKLTVETITLLIVGGAVVGSIMGAASGVFSVLTQKQQR